MSRWFYPWFTNIGSELIEPFCPSSGREISSDICFLEMTLNSKILFPLLSGAAMVPFGFFPSFFPPFFFLLPPENTGSRDVPEPITTRGIQSTKNRGLSRLQNFWCSQSRHHLIWIVATPLDGIYRSHRVSLYSDRRRLRQNSKFISEPFYPGKLTQSELINTLLSACGFWLQLGSSRLDAISVITNYITDSAK